MIKRIESGIAGRMLGATFPSDVRDLAIRFNLKGTVFVKNDGSLKIIAEGEELNLLQFTEEVRKGSLFSEIENFYVTWHEPKEGSGNFVLAN